MKKKKVMIVLMFLMLITGSFCFSKLSFSNDKESLESITEEEIMVAINKKRELIIYYGKDSCSACRVFQPVLTEAIKTTQKKVYFLDGDNFSTKKFSEKYNITGTPTMIVIKNGEVLRFEGVMEAEETIEILKLIK